MKHIIIIISLFLVLMASIVSCTENEEPLNGAFPYDEGDVATMIKVYQGMNIDELPMQYHWDLSNPARWPNWIVRWQDDSVKRKKYVVYLNLNVIGVANLKGSPYEAGIGMWTEPVNAMAHPAIGKLSHLRNLKIVNYYNCVFPFPGLYECPLETITVYYSGATAKIEGTIDWVDNLSDLKYLDVGFAGLSGSLPRLDKFPNLNTLNLIYNRFSGEIPDSYLKILLYRGPLNQRYRISLERNQGTLTFPWMSLLEIDDWSYFPSVEFCLHGEVPYEVYSDPRWDLYNMDRNVFYKNRLTKAPQPNL